mgnify:CR=1 FL=1
MRFHDGMSALSDLYDGFVVDQWGVLHNGAAAYPGAVECLTRLSAAGKRVVILTNSAKRAAANLQRLADLGFDPRAIADIVTSGEVTRTALHDRADPFFAGLGRRCFLISMPGDLSTVEGLDIDLVERPEDADFLLVTGLGEKGRTLEVFQPILEVAKRRDLPLVCANPDLVGVTAAGLIATPGALTRLYAQMGGRTRSVGKPHPEVYAECRRILGGISDDRIVAVGDSLEHDIAGGAGAGFATAFITSGIHADDLAAPGTELQPNSVLDDLCRNFGAVPDHVLPGFVW